MAQPEVVQLLPNDRILLLSEARLTIHDVPELFSVKTLDTLNSSEAEALWLLDISYGPTIDPTSNLWVFEGLPKQLLLADVTCIICIMAPTFRYIIRVPSASTLPLETSQASFAKPTLASATDVGIYRGVVKQYTTGLFCFVGNIDEWIGVDEGVTRLRYYNVSDLSTENGSEPASATLVTFDEGSGKVCVLNRFTNNIEALDFV